MVESKAGVNWAGERLSRSEHFEVGQVVFSDPDQAERARARLQAHLDEFYSRRQKKH